MDDNKNKLNSVEITEPSSMRVLGWCISIIWVLVSLLVLIWSLLQISGFIQVSDVNKNLSISVTIGSIILCIFFGFISFKAYPWRVKKNKY